MKPGKKLWKKTKRNHQRKNNRLPRIAPKNRGYSPKRTVKNMAFTIEIGYTSENASAVEKAYTIVSPTGGIEISPTSKINQLKPVFIISYNSAYVNCNYVIASFLGRKYFCTIDYEIGKQMTLNCTVDYLSSFNLRSCPVTAVRNGGIGAPTKIQDNKYPISPNEETIDQVPISHENLTPYGERCYVLQCIGGVGSD